MDLESTPDNLRQTWKNKVKYSTAVMFLKSIFIVYISSVTSQEDTEAEIKNILCCCRNNGNILIG